MIRSTRKAISLAIVVASAAGLLASASVAADGPGRKGGKAAVAQQGQSAQRVHTRTTQTQRTANGRERSTVVTDAQGRTATRDATVVNNATEAGTRTRDVTTTDRAGNTRTVASTAQKTGDGHHRDVIYTGKDGQRGTKTIDVTRNLESGSRTRQVTVEGGTGSP